MSKGSKPRPYSDKKEYYSNWDDINWSNKREEDTEAKAPSVEKVLKNPFKNDISYYEGKN